MTDNIAEHVLIGAFGGIAGLAMAYWSLPFLKTYLPTDWPRFANVSIDARVFGFALGTSLIVGVIVALPPCRRLAKGLDTITLRLGGRGTESRSHRWWREVVVGAETSLALVLLVAAALFIQTLRNMMATDYGFRPAN